MGEANKNRQDLAPMRQDVTPTCIRSCTIIVADRAGTTTEIVNISSVLTNSAEVGVCLGYGPGRMPEYTATGRQAATRCHPRGAMGRLETRSLSRNRLARRGLARVDS